MDDLVRVAVVENEPAAELSVGLLQTEGIHALWRKADSAWPAWGSGAAGGMGGPIEILVLAKDAERAHELLAQPAAE